MDVKAAPARAVALATYTPTGTPDPNVAALFAAKKGGQIYLEWNYTATNAGTQTFRKLNGFNAGEAVPQGVAAMLYAAVGMLYYEGKITSEQAEVSGTVGLGDMLNLTSGAEAWESMNAPVQTITEDVDAGKTEVGFGPPSHLSPQDLVELLRGTRRRSSSSSGSGGQRSTGTPGKSANVMGPTGHPQGTGTATPAPGALPNAFTFVNASSGGAARLGILNGVISLAGNLSFESPVTGLPTGMTPGGVPLCTLTPADSDTVAWIAFAIDVSGDSPVVTALALATGSAVPTPADDGSTFYINLGDFASTGSNITLPGVQGIGPQTVLGCGGSYVAQPT